MKWVKLALDWLFMSCVSMVFVPELVLTNLDLDPPSNIQITGPDHLLSADDQSEPYNIFTCSTDESNPAADIDWVIETDGGVKTIPAHSTAVETINQGQGWKKISTLSFPSQGTQSVKVHCVATIEDLGFSKKSDQLEVDILGKVLIIHGYTNL